MTWAGERRLIIASIVVAFGLAIVALILIPTLYQAPSCSDQTQNQGESGVDCGGPCAYLCTALEQAPVVRFSKALVGSNGRVDIIAYIDNSNINTAAHNVPYTLTLYSAEHKLLKQSTGMVDLPPSTSVPVFVPNYFANAALGVQAFLTIDPNKVAWFTLSTKVPVPDATNPTLTGTTYVPRVSATLVNKSTEPFLNTKVVAIVYDAAQNVIGASQTLVPTIPGQGSANALFTWNEAFASSPARIEVIPLASVMHP